MEAELDQMQRNHSQVDFDAVIPNQNRMRPPRQHEQFGTEQQMINQVIEESLKVNQHRPSADYDEDAELQRILEASKNER